MEATRALVPLRHGGAVTVLGQEKRQRCGSGQGLARVKWAWMAAAALAATAVAVGSIWLGFAALVPLLYTLPCLLMVAMCMKGKGANGQ